MSEHVKAQFPSNNADYRGKDLLSSDAAGKQAEELCQFSSSLVRRVMSVEISGGEISRDCAAEHAHLQIHEINTSTTLLM